MDPRFSRAYGALAGLALGDALGMPTQALSPQQIRAVYGRVTGLVDADTSQPYAPGMAAGSVNRRCWWLPSLSRAVAPRPA